MFTGYLKFEGKELEFKQELFNNVKNNFTYEFWIKPQRTIKLSLQSSGGITGTAGQSYIIGPGHPGKERANESGAGVSVGTNGVSVYEHSHNNLPSLLTHNSFINNWVHIAIVFEDKTPSLYINGNFVKKGLKSTKKNIYASGSIGGLNPYGYFVGLANCIRVWNYSRTQSEIKLDYRKKMIGNEKGLVLNLNYNQPAAAKADENFKKNLKSLTNKARLPYSQKFHKRKDTIANNNLLEDFPLSAIDKTLNEARYLSLFRNVTVDVIIPIYNSYELTKKCIESVFENADLPYNLILINDASTDKRISMFLEKIKISSAYKNLINLEIIHNENNLGYVRSVNKGLLITKNHPIILNSDTEIPPNSFRRLIFPILIDMKISSVTPFSNSATICSFPNFNEDNDLPFNMTAKEVDYYFSKYSISKGIEIPTGVGFCMALNRNVINMIGVFDDITFGKGYAEENDWCMRARRYGYKNVLAPNLFVYHKHGASFNLMPGSKQKLLAENLKRLNRRYPNYPKLINDFIINDPMKDIRDFIISIMFADKYSKRKGTLFINHNLGGGTSLYQSNLIKNIGDDQRVYTLVKESDHLILTDHNHVKPIIYKLRINKLNGLNFKKLLNAFKIDVIFINHLIGYPIRKMFNLIKNSLVDYYFFIHDFYAACPSYNLIDNKNTFCNTQTDPSICQGCVKKLFPKQNINIVEWRNEHHAFLKGAKKIFVPSNSTKDIILKYYKDLDIEVKDHSIDHSVKYTFKESFTKTQNLNIAFVGAINFAKGSKIIYELKDLIIKHKLPINIKVIGFTDSHNKAFSSNGGRFEITGKYDVGRLSEILAQKQISLAVISSIWPETYSYTTSELMLSGYPIITSKIGAPAERVKKYDGGWVLDNMTSSELLSLLKRIVNNRQEVVQKASNLKELQHRKNL
ncbi:glycosyltransferase [Cytobacillus sp. FSL H8-0458]|uniref:glycosyltransferase n=1 Tax=Cytobacillus sp. FSL H8-0458 TaxID=2975346 RepID=UPI0030F9523A